jgi:hypothetical protein
LVSKLLVVLGAAGGGGMGGSWRYGCPLDI